MGRAARRRRFTKKAKWQDAASLDEIIDELTVEAHDDDERIWNFQQALQKHIWLPCEGLVIGEPVTVMRFNYDGNQRRAVTATCRRPNGGEFEVAASEVMVPAAIKGAEYLVAYHQWMGLAPYPNAQHLLILADTGGSNSATRGAWKDQLQQHLCDRLGLTVTVAHYPTGASKIQSRGTPPVQPNQQELGR